MRITKSAITFSLTIILLLEICSAQNVNYISNRPPLKQNAYIQLPLNNIKPKGWLLKQLELARDGMTGHLDEIWKDVGSDNGWLGGSGDAWERGPYWLDGLIPLAYILNDKALIKKAQKWIDWSLNNQREDGYFGPAPDTTRVFGDSGWERRQAWQEKAKMDWWPHMVMLKVMQSYYSATGDQKVIDFMTKYFKYQEAHIRLKPLNHWTHWARSRGGENLASIYWLYNITGEKFLLDLGEIIFDQTLDWTERFESGYPRDWHGVNTGMGIKQPAVWYQYSKDKRYLDAIEKGINDLMKFHGQVYGLWAADELLAGTDPIKGTELCTIVEYMFSLETIIQISGNPEYGDKLERVAYNALPTQISKDYTKRQYYQQANQIVCDKDWHNFSTKHGETETLFGLETGYGCCTANLHQGWPKYSANLWLATQDNGLAALIYAPCEVTAKVGNKAEVVIKEETDYPFGDKIIFKILQGANTYFPLHLRIPQWCEDATILVNGEEYNKPESGTIAKVIRKWKKGDEIILHLPMKIRIGYWHERSSSVERGPLVYALGLKENWQKLEGEGKYATYQVTSDDTWNYGLLKNYIERPDTTFVVKQFEIPEYPWTIESTPVKIIAKAKKIPEWQKYGGNTGPIPYSRYWYPKVYETPEEEITLIPYGCTKLRVANFPVIR